MGTTDISMENNPFEHILYEFEMYLMSFYFDSPNNNYIKDLIVESRNVHMRNLAYFFSAKETNRSNTIHYYSYIERKLDDEISRKAEMDDVHDATSCMTCHIQEGRKGIDAKQKSYNIALKYHKRFVNLIKEFLESPVKQEHMNDWINPNIQNRVQNLLKAIAKIDPLACLISESNPNELHDKGYKSSTATTSSLETIFVEGLGK